MNILFVCKGNVGRSQMAEVIFNTLHTGKHRAFSAGTVVFDKEGNSRHGQKIGDMPEAEYVITCLKEFGFDGVHLVREQLSPEMIARADKVIVMAEQDTLPDYLKTSNKVEYWEVENPKGMSLEKHQEIFNQIHAHVKELLNSLSS